MKSLAETIEWYQAAEDRRWKLVYHFTELVLIGMAGFVIIAVLQVNGDGSQLQQLLSLFIALCSLSALVIAATIFKARLKRWQIFFITLGFGCSMGISVLASLFLLKLQLATP